MSSRKALAFSFLDRYAGLLLAILSSMVVARLLTPAEIGIFSVAMVLLSFLSAMRDFGAGQYLIQERELTTDRIRATWSVQLGLGLAFALVVLGAAVPVSQFYAEPRIRDIMFVLSLNFAISPFGSITYAWLMRELRFETLALMRFVASLTGACVTVGLAWYGMGAISLGIGSLASTVANAVIATFFRPAHFPWIPGTQGLRRVLSFGSKMSVATVLNSVGNSIPELVLGKWHGMIEVGLFSRANGLGGMFQRLILDATQSVAMPLFAKAGRDGASLGPAFLKATSYVTAIGWSFFGVMILYAPAIVRLLYGSQWDLSVPLARQAAFAFAISLPAAFCVTALIATGVMTRLVQITVITVALNVVTLGAGAALGLTYLGWALGVAAFANLLTWFMMTPVIRELSKRELTTTLARSLAVASATSCTAGVGYLYSHSHASTPYVQLAIGVFASALAFLPSLRAVHHPLHDEVVQLGSILRGRLRAMRGASDAAKP